jgi:hypothetical protein
MYISSSEALVLVPQWKSSVFYVGLTGLYDTGNVIRKYVYDGRDIFSQGQDVRSYFGPEFDANIEVWHIKF